MSLDNRAPSELSFFLRDIRHVHPENQTTYDYEIAVLRKLQAVKFLYGKLVPEKITLAFKEESQQDDISLEKTGRYAFESEVFFASFLYFIASLFDAMARITYDLYVAEVRTLGISNQSFKKQMKFFISTEPKRDADYTRLLEANSIWIKKLFANRDAFTHFFSPFLGFDNKGTVIFENRKPAEDDPNREASFESLETYARDTMTNLLCFLSGYVIVQRKRVPETEITKMQREQINKENFQP